MLDKLQGFLKNKHKFDPKIDTPTQIEKLNNSYARFIDSVRKEDPSIIKPPFAIFLVDLIKFANTKNINLTELLKNETKLNL